MAGSWTGWRFSGSRFPEMEVVRLTAGEVGDAALGHGLDAFLEVVGQAQASLLGKFVLGRHPDAIGEIGPHGRSPRDQAERCVLRDFSGEPAHASGRVIDLTPAAAWHSAFPA
jgi:hypothetical protein